MRNRRRRLPLYLYSGDTKKGEANGDGISSYGGTWHVVMSDGSAMSGTKSSTGNGYSY